MAGALSSAAIAKALPSMAAAGPPFPTWPEGRIAPAEPAAYDSAMMSGGPGKDGIPAIDDPAFWSAAEAGDYLDDDDIVFGLAENGVVRAYPQRILVWHEIVNDRVAGTGLAVTYCPLTGTAIAFERSNTEFGVSGNLVNSNLIMYDRDTDTWFPQILAVGIRGPHTGAALVERPVVWTSWRRWRAANPETEVLSTSTGFARNYGRDPYGAYNPQSGYYLPDSGRMFPVMNEDGRFPAKSMVLGARTRDAAAAFPLERLREEHRLDLDVNGETFTAIYDAALDSGYVFRGATRAEAAIDGAGPAGVTWTGGPQPESLNTFQAMWFAWAAFYPQTAVHA